MHQFDFKARLAMGILQHMEERNLTVKEKSPCSGYDPLILQ